MNSVEAIQECINIVKKEVSFFQNSVVEREMIRLVKREKDELSSLFRRRYTKEEIKEIQEGAGKIKRSYVNWRFPFLHRFNLVFGGHCGLCGKWNWQWCEEFFEWTGPCKKCGGLYG